MPCFCSWFIIIRLQYTQSQFFCILRSLWPCQRAKYCSTRSIRRLYSSVIISILLCYLGARVVLYPRPSPFLWFYFFFPAVANAIGLGRSTSESDISSSPAKAILIVLVRRYEELKPKSYFFLATVILISFGPVPRAERISDASAW